MEQPSKITFVETHRRQQAAQELLNFLRLAIERNSPVDELRGKIDALRGHVGAAQLINWME